MLKHIVEALKISLSVVQMIVQNLLGNGVGTPVFASSLMYVKYLTDYSWKTLEHLEVLFAPE